MNIIERVKNILITPKTEWDVIDSETATPQSLLMSYVLPLAVISAVGPLVQGLLFAGASGFNYFLVLAIVAFIGTVLSYYVTIYIIDALSTSFASEKDINKTAQLVAYSRTPGYVAGLLSFIPILGMIIALLGWAYSIYIMYLGLGPLKKTPEDKKVVYLIVSFILIFIVSMVIGAILGMILFSAMGIGAVSTGRFGM
ncbi:MAG: DUF1282 domain-containing protein [Chitinophagaceae bacterium]|nr:MAG: DUF1282 domain-containing protein [Chitinophagaceae bacterium]